MPPARTRTIEEREREIEDRESAIVLCHNCGWHGYHEIHTAYDSNIKCFFSHECRGVWKIGDNYIIKEQPLLNRYREDYAGHDAETTNWVRENTTIPVSSEMKHWRDKNSNYFWMRRVPGESLERAWVGLTEQERMAYAREVVGYLKQLRKHTAESMQSVTGTPVRNTLLAGGGNIVTTIEDWETWWKRVHNDQRGLKNKDKAEYKESYPDQAVPYVLTHGDLNTGNIMVHNGHVSGIIDWEHSGYYPEWWEFATVFDNVENGTWMTYLMQEMRKQLGSHDEVALFCHKFKLEYRGQERKIFPSTNFPRVKFCDCKADLLAD